MARRPRERESAGGGVVLLVVVVLALLVGGGWAAAYLLSEDKLPHGTEVAGVDVGDRTRADAAKALERGLAARNARPIIVVARGTPVAVDPARAGLSIDVDATVAQATAGRSWDPRKLWSHYTTGSDLSPVVRLDQARLAAAARKIDARAGRPARDGTVRFVGGQVVTTDPVPGRGVDPAQLAGALRAAYLSAGDRRVDVPLRQIQPAIDATDVQAAVDHFANPAMTAPVTLMFGRTSVRLAPTAYARALSLVPSAGVLRPKLDTAALTRLVDAGIAAATRARAHPTVQPASAIPAVSFDPADAATIFMRLVTQPEGRRQAAVPVTAPQVGVVGAP